MNKKVLIKGEALQASVVSALAAEQFLTQNYIFHRNHLNLSNKFDKEMALTNNLIVCLDELEAIRPAGMPR